MIHRPCIGVAPSSAVRVGNAVYSTELSSVISSSPAATVRSRLQRWVLVGVMGGKRIGRVVTIQDVLFC